MEYKKMMLRNFRANLPLSFFQRRFSHKAQQFVRSDFMGIQGVGSVHAHLKKGDSVIAAKLLRQTNLLKFDPTTPLRLLDIGGGDGTGIVAFSQALGKPIVSYNIEPSKDETRIYKYMQAAKMSNSFLSVHPVVIRKKVEDQECKLPEVDIALAGHSLYYNQKEWFLHQNLSTHLFTKILAALQQNGVFCVILQSVQPTKKQGKHNVLINHEQWEDRIYPLIENMPHSHNPYHANAEMLHVALDHFQKLYVNHTGQFIPWTVQTETAITEIPLGDVSLIPDRFGNYQQPQDVQETLGFYLKGRELSKLPQEVQNRIINLLQEHCQTEDGRFVITHVNSIFTIQISEAMRPVLQSLASHNENQTRFRKSI